MKLFFINHKNYREAGTWIDTYSSREEKKRILQPIVGTQNSIAENLPGASQSGKVVFTRADNGHNLEEAKKIQGIYAELDNVAFAPVFA